MRRWPLAALRGVGMLLFGSESLSDSENSSRSVAVREILGG